MGNEVDTGQDALHFEQSSTEIQQLRAIRTLDGVAVTFASGRNGPGIGRLKSTGNGTVLSYRAPGSSTFGRPVVCGTNAGEYRLDDGEDVGKYVRIQIWTSKVIPGSAQANVRLDDIYGNGISNDDVTASEAAAGDVADHNIQLKNYSNTILSHVKVWLDKTVVYLQISDDDATWISPTTESTAQDIADILPGATQTLYFRRTIVAGTSRSSGILNLLHCSYTGG
jgi:hypothetical protein